MLAMDSCVAVEKEIDRVINKFTAINEHSSQVIGDVVNHILELKNHLEEGELRMWHPEGLQQMAVGQTCFDCSPWEAIESR